MSHGSTTVEKCLFKGNNGEILVSEVDATNCYHTDGFNQSNAILIEDFKVFVRRKHELNCCQKT